jgi:uncharacterized membrane protein
MKPDRFFSKEDKDKIVSAIKNAELNSTGEIRVHVDGYCKEDVLDRAAHVFAKLKMHETEKRNGVLFYLSVNDHKFAILGDAGINKVTPDDFWDNIKSVLTEHFKKSEFALGLATGIEMAGMALKEFFPYDTSDTNELSDDISFGKN